MFLRCVSMQFGVGEQDVGVTNKECVLQRTENQSIKGSPAQPLKYPGRHVLREAILHIHSPHKANADRRRRSQVHWSLAVHLCNYEAAHAGESRDHQRNGSQSHSRRIRHAVGHDNAAVDAYQQGLHDPDNGYHVEQCKKVQILPPNWPVLHRVLVAVELPPTTQSLPEGLPDHRWAEARALLSQTFRFHI
jgi:hypothetical protein